jgi:hypothetical protein
MLLIELEMLMQMPLEQLEMGLVLLKQEKELHSNNLTIMMVTLHKTLILCKANFLIQLGLMYLLNLMVLENQ